MLTRILHRSDQLCAFIDQLDVHFSRPQRRHIVNMADALLVCEDEKTLAALQRQFVEAPDASNMADFLRISPWCSQTVRGALRSNQVAWVLAEAERRGLPKVITVNIDDSLGEKHKDTRHLEPVDWHYDHVESSKHRPRYKNGICYLVCTLRIGDLFVTVDLRLYLRAKTVRQINRQRPQEQHIPFLSKYRLARRILVEWHAPWDELSDGFPRMTYDVPYGGHVTEPGTGVQGVLDVLVLADGRVGDQDGTSSMISRVGVLKSRTRV